MSDAWKRAVWVPWPHSAESAGPRVASPGPRYLDPAILRGLTSLAPSPAPPRETIHVPDPLHDYAPGDRVEIGATAVDQRLRTLTVSTHWATVVSWDRASGELVVQPDG